ncbi:hypothetical protein LTR85_011072 [Meristemomyces frigidus]|nr:hypothetical protein LTR85_011072 [Meristemomyces frigidus]
MAMELALKREEAGIALANSYLSIFGVAHLYNAVRQQKLLDSEDEAHATAPTSIALKFVHEYSHVLPRLVADIRLDYIALTSVCNALMVALRIGLLRGLGANYPTSAVPDGDSNAHRMGDVYMVLGVLSDNNKAAAFQESVNGHRNGDRFEGGEQLKVVAKTMVEFLRGKHPGQLIRRMVA